MIQLKSVPWQDRGGRIASFDKQAFAAVKSLVNRHGLPTQDALVIKAGLSKPGDFELRLGHHLGHLMALAADKDGAS